MESGRTDTEEFIFLIIIDSNFRVKWLLFLRQRVKKAEESLKLRHNFISRCSKVDYRKPKGSGYGKRAITVTATDKVIKKCK